MRYEETIWNILFNMFSMKLKIYLHRASRVFIEGVMWSSQFNFVGSLAILDKLEPKSIAMFDAIDV
jgi:hypothetical protein